MTNAPLRNSELIKVEGTKKEKESPKLTLEVIPKKKKKNQLTLEDVRTRFVTNSNSVGFARKKAQTISLVERGFERLGLSHQTVGFSWCSYMI